MLSRKLKFTPPHGPMPLKLVAAPFVGCIILPLVMVLASIHNHHNVTLSSVIMIIGILIFAVTAWLRNKMWHNGAFYPNAAARQQPDTPQ